MYKILIPLILLFFYTIAIHSQDFASEPDIIKILNHTTSALIGYGLYMLYQINKRIEENNRLLHDVRTFYERLKTLVESEKK